MVPKLSVWRAAHCYVIWRLSLAGRRQPCGPQSQQQGWVWRNSRIKGCWQTNPENLRSLAVLHQVLYTSTCVGVTIPPNFIIFWDGLAGTICWTGMEWPISVVLSVPYNDHCFFIYRDDGSVGDVEEKKPAQNSMGKTSNDRFAKDEMLQVS